MKLFSMTDTWIFVNPKNHDYRLYTGHKERTKAIVLRHSTLADNVTMTEARKLQGSQSSAGPFQESIQSSVNGSLNLANILQE